MTATAILIGLSACRAGGGSEIATATTTPGAAVELEGAASAPIAETTRTTTLAPTSPTVTPTGPGPLRLAPGASVAVDPEVFAAEIYPTVVPWGDGFLSIASVADENDDEAPTPYRAVFTSDGSVQAEFEFELPVGFAYFTATDDRLVVVGPGHDRTNEEPTLTISTSTDLIDWHTSNYDLVVDVDDPSLEIVDTFDAGNAEVVVVGDRWYAITYRDRTVRWEHLLPVDVQEALATAAVTTWGYSTDGVEFEAFNYPDSGKWAFTWEELGVDEESRPYLAPLWEIPGPDSYVGPERVLLAGDFGGNYETLTLPEQTGQLQPGGDAALVPYGDGLMLVGWNVYTSRDGHAWREIGQVRTNRYETEGIEVLTAGANVLFFDVNADDGMTRIEPDGEFVPVDFPEHLAGFYTSWGESAVGIVAGPSTGAEWWEQDLWLVATRDGVDWFTLDLPDLTGDTTDDGEEVMGFPTGVVMNDDLIMYETVDGWRIIRMS